MNLRNGFEKLTPAVDKFMSESPSVEVEAVILTAKAEDGAIDSSGKQYDYFLRFFCPWLGISEDPVTGW